MLELNTLLTPVDFSAASKAAFLGSLALAVGEDRAVILLHVVDSALVEQAVQMDLGTADELLQKLRAKAEAVLNQWKSEVETTVDVQVLVCDGAPFVEIIRKAEEFQVDAVVMSKHSSAGRPPNGHLEKLLFGSTAERVVRWATRPVLVVPPL